MTLDLSQLSEMTKFIVPEGHKDALVGTVDKNGVELISGMKLNDSGTWELQGSFEHKWSGDNDASIKILWSR